MSDFLTVKEFADVAGVSSQRIYKLISTKSNGLATDIQQYCKSIKGRKYIHSDALKLFNNDSIVVNEIQPDSTAELNDKNSLLQSEVDVLKAETKALREQIADRDKTIERLEEDKAKLNERLDKAETNISNLATALTAAQALHGMDKQQAVIDVKTADGELCSPSSTSEDQIDTHQQPQQKLSFLDRLFKRSKKQR